MSFNSSRISNVVDRNSSTIVHNTAYTYDNLGRITAESDSVDTNRNVTYQYDAFGQLVRENNKLLDKTLVYEYNGIGNIVSVKTYSYTTADTPSGSYSEKTYLYNANHLDRLISYSGKSISYNSYGYPTSYDGKTYAWTRGRLTGISSGSLTTGTSSYTFEYNAYGQRTKFNYSYAPPLNGAVQMDYVSSSTKTFEYDNSGRLISQKQIRVYNTNDSDTQTLRFIYDGNIIIGFVYVNLSGGVRTENDYYFVRNLQGDVTEILDENGNIVVTYKYDAFGNCTTTSSSSLGSINPIRYRGYYYDQDTKLYYLNSRYYNPEWRRFISPDDTSYIDPESVNGLNLYCYCNNDPVNFVDPSGHWIETVFDLLSLGVSVVEVVINPADPLAWAGLAGDALDLLPFVTGVGETIKGVRIVAKGVDLADDTLDTIRIAKAVDFADDTWDEIRALNKVGDYTQSTAAAGRKIHNGYKAFDPLGKEVHIIGGRIDYLSPQAIYELKPFNRSGVRGGVKQLVRYKKIKGSHLLMILELY